MTLFPPPGPERRRAVGLLVLLAIMAAAYFGPQYWPSTTVTPAPTSNTEGRAQFPDKKIQLPDTVKVDTLERAPDASTPERNPFRFGEKPKPPAPPPAPPPVWTPPVQQAPPPPPGPPPIELKCLFTLQVQDTKQWLGAMQDPGGGMTIWSKDGEVIDGKYKVVKVNADSVVVSYLDGTGRRQIRCGG